LDVVQGEKFIYSEPILPYQDANRVLELTDPIIKKLPKADRDRNKVSKDVLRFNFLPKNKNSNKETVFAAGGGKRKRSKK
jgi:5'-3' exonuclease